MRATRRSFVLSGLAAALTSLIPLRWRLKAPRGDCGCSEGRSDEPTDLVFADKCEKWSDGVGVVASPYRWVVLGGVAGAQIEPGMVVAEEDGVIVPMRPGLSPIGVATSPTRWGYKVAYSPRGRHAIEPS
jgi:hypothetical protein